MTCLETLYLNNRGELSGRWLTRLLPSYVFAVFQGSLPHGISRDPEQNIQSYPKTIPTFLTLFIFGCVYQLVLVWDALRLKNTIQVIGLCMYNIGTLIYAAVQMDEIEKAAVLLARPPHQDLWNNIRPYLIAIPCVVALGTVLMSFIAWKLYDEFAWTIYKHISADLRMKRRYLTFQVYMRVLHVLGAKNTYRSLDLHCSSEIRFLLFPRIHHSIRCCRDRQEGSRIRFDHCRDSCNDSYSAHGRGVDSKGKQSWHECYHSKLSHTGLPCCGRCANPVSHIVPLLRRNGLLHL